MLTTQFPAAGTQTQRPKSGRRPLQPRNIPANPIEDRAVAKPKPEWSESLATADSNKENHWSCVTPMKMESLDASLAEELSAMRKKGERLRLDKERTERTLRERDSALEMQMREIEMRGEVQKRLEMEVDRLYRLKQLKYSCLTITSIRTLREKEQGRGSRDAESQTSDMKVADDEDDESMDVNITQSPSSVSSEIVPQK